MSRYAHHIFKVHIADGFANDCEELIQKCVQVQTLDYQTFCELWKELNFGMIYQGRINSAEIAEFTEEVVHIAKYYLVRDTSNIEESIASLFILYGLLKLQPYDGFVWLRITPEDLPAINKIETFARKEKRLDILYILGEVLMQHSHYHVAERERGMEYVLRKYLEEFTSIDKLGVRPKGVLMRRNEEVDILKDLGPLTRQYMRAKIALSGGEKSTDFSLKYVNDNVPNKLNESLRRVINGIVNIDVSKEAEDAESDSSEDHYSNVQAIKKKAMTAMVNPIRHLESVEHRETKATSPKKNFDLKSPTGKIKTGSPTKLVTNSVRNIISEPSQTKRKRRKIEKDTKIHEDTNEENPELNIEEFNKAITNDNVVCTENINIDVLPVLSRLDDNGIEIEVIDNMEQGVASNEKDKAPEENTSKSTNDEVLYAESVQRKTRRARLLEELSTEPKNVKRPKLKSKFRRYGAMPVPKFDYKSNEAT